MPIETEFSVYHCSMKARQRIARLMIWLVVPVRSFLGTNQRRSRKISLLMSEQKPITTAGQERRDEDDRRRKRADDVKIGKTSAQPGAKNYGLDVSTTEAEWLRQASDVEQLVFTTTQEGLEHLYSLDLEMADECFERVRSIKPQAYLWQAGLVKYYLGDFETAAEILSQQAQIYETRFGDAASEERIWRDAAELAARKKKFIGDLPKVEGEADFRESRIVWKTTRNLFEASVHKDFASVVIARAKLRLLAGQTSSDRILDAKKWKLSSWFYLGLHYDAMGKEAQAKECMKVALRLSPAATSGTQDLIQTLPTLHMKVRDWFDHDDYSEEAEDPARTRKQSMSPTVQVGLHKDVHPVILESIQSSLYELKLTELQETLRKRGLRVKGSKAELRERLFKSLVGDDRLLM